MTNFDKEKVEELLNNDKLDEAAEMIKAYLNEEDDSSEAAARLKSAMALVYLDTMIKINEAYEASLKEAISQIKDLRRMTRDAKEAARLKHVGAKIEGLKD